MHEGLVTPGLKSKLETDTVQYNVLCRLSCPPWTRKEDPLGGSCLAGSVSYAPSVDLPRPNASVVVFRPGEAFQNMIALYMLACTGLQ